MADDSDSRLASVTEEDIECWSYDKTDVAQLFVRHSDMLSLGWNVTLGLRPHVDISLTNVRHLYTVRLHFRSAGLFPHVMFSLASLGIELSPYPTAIQLNITSLNVTS